MPDPKKGQNPYDRALSNLEARRQALGTSSMRPEAVAEWERRLQNQALAMGLEPGQVATWTTQLPLLQRMPMIWTGAPGGSRTIAPPWGDLLTGIAAGSGTTLPEAMAALMGPSAAPGGTTVGAGAGLPGIPEDLPYTDPVGWQVYNTLGPEGYSAYLWNKAGIKPSTGGTTGPFGMAAEDWARLGPERQQAFMNEMAGMKSADLATWFGLSEGEWKSLSPEQQASLKNYVSRMPDATGAGGDPYAGQKMQLAWAQLAQERQLAEAQLAARRREMAANIGQSVAQLRQQGWQTGLPWSLPKGSMFAPGFSPGGPLSQLYAMSGSTYNPQEYFLAKNNPPSSDQIMNWVNEAMGRFG